MRRIILISVFAVAGCSSSPSLPPTVQMAPVAEIVAAEPVKLTAAQKKTVESQIARELKDPVSARFGVINAGKSKTDGMIIICGWVNAKNSYGGYTGEQPFYGWYLPNAGTAGSFQIGGTEIEIRVVRKQCIDNGVPLSALPTSS